MLLTYIIKYTIKVRYMKPVKKLIQNFEYNLIKFYVMVDDSTKLVTIVSTRRVVKFIGWNARFQIHRWNVESDRIETT